MPEGFKQFDFTKKEDVAKDLADIQEGDANLSADSKKTNSDNPKKTKPLKMGYEKFRSDLAKKLFEAKDRDTRRQIFEDAKKKRGKYTKSFEKLFRDMHQTERMFILDIKKAGIQNEAIDNLASLEKVKSYGAHLYDEIGVKEAYENFSYDDLLFGIDAVCYTHPVLYSAIIENKIDILDFRHTAFRGPFSKVKFEENQSDEEKINITLSQPCWKPLFVCCATEQNAWIDKPEFPMIFFDNKKVLKKVFENYDTKNISGFHDDEAKKYQSLLVSMVSEDSAGVWGGGIHPLRPFMDQRSFHKGATQERKDSYSDRRIVPRAWKILFNGQTLADQGTCGITPIRLHDNSDGVFKESIRIDRFEDRLKEMTDQKMSLDEMQEQIDKEFMYRADAETTISPLIMDNSFIRAIYLNGKIYNNKGEVILEEKAKEQIQEKTEQSAV